MVVVVVAVVTVDVVGVIVIFVLTLLLLLVSVSDVFSVTLIRVLMLSGRVEADDNVHIVVDEGRDVSSCVECTLLVVPVLMSPVMLEPLVLVVLLVLVAGSMFVVLLPVATNVSEEGGSDDRSLEVCSLSDPCTLNTPLLLSLLLLLPLEYPLS